MASDKGFGESFYVCPDAVVSGRVIVGGTEARHMATVLRRRAGDVIQLTDGRGARYRVRLTKCTASRVEGEIEAVERFQLPEPELWVAVGLIRAPRMDDLVERCTELGAAAIIPLCTARSLSGGEVSDSRLLRWQRIAAAAMTQSARLFLPCLRKPVPLRLLAGLAGPHAGLLVAEPSGESLRSLDARSISGRRLVSCVGPEGGFTPDEVVHLRELGARPISLGNARLRTETAAAAILDRLSFLVGRG